jgi:hypothetical protein
MRNKLEFHGKLNFDILRLQSPLSNYDLVRLLCNYALSASQIINFFD